MIIDIDMRKSFSNLVRDGLVFCKRKDDQEIFFRHAPSHGDICGNILKYAMLTRARWRLGRCLYSKYNIDSVLPGNASRVEFQECAKEADDNIDQSSGE